MNKNNFATIWQHIIPQHALSRLIGKLANCHIIWLKSFLIKLFIKYYKISLTEAAETDLKKYPTFNSFFTRALNQNARPIPIDENIIISPVDGRLSQFGKIDGTQLIQAKSYKFDLNSLLSPHLKNYTEQFTNGEFATIYLAPSDYHRIHMSFSGQLLSSTYIAGKLFSVNPTTTNNIPQIFARNERLINIFDTNFGPMAIIFVGAMLVASIETVWAGQVVPNNGKNIQSWNYQGNNINFQRGAELGRFQFGSTVILLFPPNTITWNNNIHIESPLKMGQKLAQLTYNRQ